MSAAGTPRPGITIPFDGIPLHAHREWFTRIRELGYTDIWSAEVDGADGFTPLALAAAWEPSLNLGVAITPAYTRGPALLAQSVAAMADAAPGRFACGLGASSEAIVANWNGLAFENQYGRVKDILRFLRMAFSGEKVTEEFPIPRQGIPAVACPRAAATHLPGCAAARDVAPGRPRGRRGHPELAQRRRRAHLGGRSGEGGPGHTSRDRRPDLRHRHGGRRTSPARSAGG